MIMVLGRYGYMTFDLWAQNLEQTSVPAGTFRMLKVIMRVDADLVMKYWPAFLRQLAQPFFPKNVLYHDTEPPHHLVKFVGSLGYTAPEVTVQLAVKRCSPWSLQVHRPGVRWPLSFPPQACPAF
jgi:hypothetical protein